MTRTRLALFGLCLIVTPLAAQESPVKPVSHVEPAAAPISAYRDTQSLTTTQRQAVTAFRLAADWLVRSQQSNGTFLPGYNPAMNKVVEDNHPLVQASAAFGLCRAAKLTADAKTRARAAQAVLALVAMTRKTTEGRTPFVPDEACNHAEFAGWLLACAHELPDAPADLLDQSEELAGLLKSRLKETGELRAEPANVKPDADTRRAAGVALWGLALSQKKRPQAWKAEALKKSAAYYPPLLLKEFDVEAAAIHCSALAEEFFVTGDTESAKFAGELAEKLCRLQCDQPDPRRPDWQGGFRASSAVGSAPTLARSAACLAAIADAMRALRKTPRPDADRFARLKQAATLAIDFVSRMQYGENNTGHIMPQFRQQLVGGLPTSVGDGVIRVEVTASALSGLHQYLWAGVEK